MLWLVFVVLMTLWLVGLIGSFTFGGFLNVLLAVAVVAMIFQILTGGRTTQTPEHAVSSDKPRREF